MCGIVYAEFDDNVIYRMHPETWRSRTGAPWPYLHEFEQGCTYEHVGYHLTWLCAIFGPVRSVTAFSKRVLPDKTDKPLDPAGHAGFFRRLPRFRERRRRARHLQHRRAVRPPHAHHRQRGDADRRHLPALPVPGLSRAVQPALAQRAQGDVGEDQHGSAGAVRRRRQENPPAAHSPARRGARTRCPRRGGGRRAMFCARCGAGNSASRTRPSASRNSPTRSGRAGRPFRRPISPCISRS